MRWRTGSPPRAWSTCSRIRRTWSLSRCSNDRCASSNKKGAEAPFLEIRGCLVAVAAEYTQQLQQAREQVVRGDVELQGRRDVVRLASAHDGVDLPHDQKRGEQHEARDDD